MVQQKFTKMLLADRIQSFSALGERLRQLPADTRQQLQGLAANENAWFTGASVSLALAGIQKYLEPTALQRWAGAWPEPARPRLVGVVMAGNIPLVGFHDLLSVLISGHHLAAKLSTQDSALMKWIIAQLTDLDARWAQRIHLVERLNDVDAVIATGSDNTARYFEYYFRSKPHIIRKNRTAVGVVQGSETTEELARLGDDIFSYFGLGCRNVSKIFVPEEFDLRTLPPAWHAYESIAHHHKWANNYEYQKAILLVNQQPFLDTGFSILMESKALVSPISVLYVERYADQADLKSKLEAVAEKIQCVVSARGWYNGSFPFGEAQCPALTDYADGVDTLKFLSGLA